MEHFALSTDVSSIENLRRMAEHNAQATRSFVEIQKQLIGHPTDKVRMRCMVASLMLLGLGILTIFTYSILLGGAIVLSTMIPWVISKNYSEKVDLLMARLQAESQNLKFIYTQIHLLFVNAIQQKQKALIQQWNDSPSMHLNSMETDEFNEHVSQEFKRMIEDYDDKQTLTIIHNNKEEEVSYKNLKRYALSISNVLHEWEKGSVKKLIHPVKKESDNNPKAGAGEDPNSVPVFWIDDLQHMAVCFNRKYRPNMKKHDFDPLEPVDPKFAESRQFSYLTPENVKVTTFCFLKDITVNFE